MLVGTILLPPGGKTETDVWATPDWLFAALDKEFGFKLDPCSTHENAKCDQHYTMHENGLLKDWGTETCSEPALQRVRSMDAQGIWRNHRREQWELNTWIIATAAALPAPAAHSAARRAANTTQAGM